MREYSPYLAPIVDPERAGVSLTSFFGHENATLRTYFSYLELTTIVEDLSTLLALLESGRLTPEPGLTDSWSRLVPALDALRDGRVDGKAVLMVD